MNTFFPDDLAAILSGTKALNQSFLVGGCVRDWLLGVPVKDFDLEVYGLDYESLTRALAPFGRTDLVGRSFGVVKLTTRAGRTYDFTVPRRDSKTGAGHKGFAVSFDPGITQEAAAARRDFTINALAFDPRRGEVLDFFGGQEDLRRRVLRHTSAAFVEDPLRVLRGMQFAGRFDLQAAPETVALCRDIKSGFGELAVERVREEWFKWAAQSRKPSAGMRFLAATEWLEHFPEIHRLAGTLQDPQWHPEGNVFVHTCHCLDELVTLPGWRDADAGSRVAYSLAVLLHDTGKPQTTAEVERDGRLCIVSPGHDEVGGVVAASFLERIRAPLAIRERVTPLVVNHMAHLQVITPRGVRRLARRLMPETIQALGVVITADAFGRPPKPRELPAGLVELQRVAAQLDLEAAAPRPLLMGRHLVELGKPPGRNLGAILEAAFEAQLDGKFSDLDGAFRWLRAESGLALPADVRSALEARTQGDDG